LDGLITRELAIIDALPLDTARRTSLITLIMWPAPCNAPAY